MITISACTPAVRVPVPHPTGAAAEACGRLAGELPAKLAGRERRATEPESPYIAVWGDPGIALRCGVPRPPAMDPAEQIPEINGVAWYEQPADAPTLFTAIGREAYVEMTIPRTYRAPEILVDLSAPIKKAIPK